MIYFHIMVYDVGGLTGVHTNPIIFIKTRHNNIYFTSEYYMFIESCDILSLVPKMYNIWYLRQMGFGKVHCIDMFKQFGTFTKLSVAPKPFIIGTCFTYFWKLETKSNSL